MKILNLYAGIGGNRKLWSNEHDITAVEYDENIALIYKNYFPNDNVIVTDAHDYLMNNYKKYDFIWTSPPCQTHSSFRQNICVKFRGTKAVYPDMKLYQEILFLKYNFDGKYVVENVKPYYEALIKPNVILQRHYFWNNFDIPVIKFDSDLIRKAQIPDLEKKHGYNLNKYKLKNKRQVLRNCVSPVLGEYILNEALK